MEKCMICGSKEGLARRGEVVLCRRCLRVIYAVMREKIAIKREAGNKKQRPD